MVCGILYAWRRGPLTSCIDIIKKFETGNSINYGNINAYRNKFKKFLTAVALSMKPATLGMVLMKLMVDI